MAKRITAKAFYEHIEEDKKEFQAGRLRDSIASKQREEMAQNIKEIHLRLDSVATKEDFAEFKEFMQKWRIGWSLLGLSGTTIMKIGTVVLALAAIFGGWKALVAYFVMK